MSVTSPLMKRGDPAEFVFRGNAVAAAGFVTKLNETVLPPNPTVVTTHGESSIPLIGGVSHVLDRQPALPFPNNIRYDTCETFVSGLPSGPNMETHLRASVNNFNVTTSPSTKDNQPRVQSITFHADHFQIEVLSTYPPDGLPSFQVLKREALGMSIIVTDKAGTLTTTLLQVVFDDDVIGLHKASDFDNEFRTNRRFFDEHVDRFPADPRPVFKKSGVPRTAQGYILASIVKGVQLGTDAIRPGNTLTVPGFGQISFGLLLIDNISHRISMAKVKFGSDPGGDAAAAGVETNGIWK